MMKSNSPRHASAARILLSARRDTPESIEPSDDLCAQILYILKLSAILRAFGQTKNVRAAGEKIEMTGYTIALFLHIVGALGMFVALAFEWVAWAGLRRSATVQEARGWLGLLALVRRVGPASLGLILVAGLYMTATVVGWTAWILVALASFVVIAALGGISNGRSLPAIERALQIETGPISDVLRQRMSAPTHAASARTIGLAVQEIALVGTLIGVFTIAIGVGPRTVPDIAYHLTIIAVLVGGLILAWRAPRQPFTPPTRMPSMK